MNISSTPKLIVLGIIVLMITGFCGTVYAQSEDHVTVTPVTEKFYADTKDLITLYHTKHLDLYKALENSPRDTAAISRIEKEILSLSMELEQKKAEYMESISRFSSLEKRINGEIDPF